MGAGEVHLVESDQRKAAFLREVSRETQAGATIHACRIEDLEGLEADVITARALAPLTDLLAFAEPLLAAGGCCFFLKGRSAQEELTAAAREWKMEVTQHISRSDADATLLEIRGLHRAP